MVKAPKIERLGAGHYRAGAYYVFHLARDHWSVYREVDQSGNSVPIDNFLSYRAARDCALDCALHEATND